MKCKECGRPIDPATQICGYCGAAAGADAKPKAAAPASKKKAAAASSAKKENGTAQDTAKKAAAAAKPTGTQKARKKAAAKTASAAKQTAAEAQTSPKQQAAAKASARTQTADKKAPSPERTKKSASAAEQAARKAASAGTKAPKQTASAAEQAPQKTAPSGTRKGSAAVAAAARKAAEAAPKASSSSTAAKQAAAAAALAAAAKQAESHAETPSAEELARRAALASERGTRRSSAARSAAAKAALAQETPAPSGWRTVSEDAEPAASTSFLDAEDSIRQAAPTTEASSVKAARILEDPIREAAPTKEVSDQRAEAADAETSAPETSRKVTPAAELPETDGTRAPKRGIWAGLFDDLDDLDEPDEDESRPDDEEPDDEDFETQDEYTEDADEDDEDAAAAAVPVSRTRKSSHSGKGHAAAEQLPGWLIPAACTAAVALLLTGVLTMFLRGNNEKNTLESLPDTLTETTEYVPETTEPITETEAQTEETTESALDTDAEWALAYYDAIREYESNHKSVNPERSIKYRLLYIDDNEIPELFIQAEEASALYTIVNDNEVKQIYAAESDAEEKLIGVRTRRGMYLSSKIDPAGSRYVVNVLRDGEVSETEVAESTGENCSIDGTPVDLVNFMHYIHAKETDYQLTDIPVYLKSQLLNALEDAANSEELPAMAEEEQVIEIVELTEPEETESTEASETTEAGTATSGQKTFTVYSGSYTWSGAKAQCEAKGGHLAYIKSAEDYNAVMAAVRAAGGSLQYLWVGGTTSITDSGVVARWADGSSTSYLDSSGLWFTNQPSGRDGDTLEPYIMLWNPNGNGWSFNDNSDSCVNIYAVGTMGYVCEVD